MFFGKKTPPTPPAAAPAPPPVNAAPPVPASMPPMGQSAMSQAAAVPPAASAAAAAGATLLDPEEAKRRAVLAKRAAASFGEVISLLMLSPTEKHYTLQDLEWLVVPAIMTGQFAVADAQSRETGAVMPVGAVLWAHVSADVDRQLSAALDTAPRLRPQDWKSGDIPWIIMSIGDPKVVGGLLQQLTKTVFKDRPAKIRAKGPDGKIVVGRLEIGAPAPQ